MEEGNLYSMEFDFTHMGMINNTKTRILMPNPNLYFQVTPIPGLEKLSVWAPADARKRSWATRL